MLEIDTLFKSILNINNLKLAFYQLETSQNISYKNYYRELFLSYRIKIDENLNILKSRLEQNIYSPKGVLRFYVPKKTGLHRSISFLHLDDLIIYQSIANVVKKKFIKKREAIENINVFSNLLNYNKNKELFFFKNWKIGYITFLKEIKKLFNSGNCWVAHFDLASFYDTISHNRLISEIYKNESSRFNTFFSKCLKTWSTHKITKIDHGIPQGPNASDFFAEIYLLPIDKTLSKNNIKYLRYVDDIKIFGFTKSEVLNGIIILEKECKERGLIPQIKKYEIIKAKTIDEAIGKFPSLTNDDKKNIFSDDKENISILFKEAFNEEQLNIARIKYILKMVYKNNVILELIKKNILLYPDLIDYFYSFLFNYTDNVKVGLFIYNLLKNNNIIYEYVEGKLWDLLSNWSIHNQYIIDLACIKLKKSRNKYSLKLGIYKYLCSTNSNLILKWLDKEPSDLIQMMVLPHVPIIALKSKNFQENILNRSDYEPGLILYKQLFTHNIDISNLPIGKNDNTGILENLKNSYLPDAINIILNNIYKIPKFNKWKIFFDREYEHANNILYLSSKSFDSDRNAWLNYFDTFNDIVTRQFVNVLFVKKNSIKWPPLINKNSEIIDFGIILDKNNKLSTHYSNIFNGIREFHNRRSSSPTSHAYIKKTSGRTTFLSNKEKKILLKKLIYSYTNLINELKNLKL